jgi:hypothetical protein
MVKLIKLSSNTLIDNKARFTTYFNEDIHLKENSKIALRNLQLSPENVDIVTAGQGMKVSLWDNLDGSKNYKTILIPAGEYITDYGLAYEVYQALNSAFVLTDTKLIRTGIYNRIMWNVQFDDNNKMNIDYKQIEDLYNTSLTTNENISYDDGTLVYSKTDNFGTYDYLSTGSLPVCLCTGTLKFIISGSDLGGCLIGVVKEIISTAAVTIDDFYFAVYTADDGLGASYVVKKSGEPALDTGVLVQLNDVMEIRIQLGKFLLYVNGVNINNVNKSIEYTLTNEDDHEAIQQYYPYFGLKNQNSQMKDITWTQNPFFSTNENGTFFSPVDPLLIQSSVNDAVPSNVTIDFLNEFNYNLGFSKSFYQNNAVSGTFSAENSTTELRLPDGLYVVIDNLRLNSYDYNVVDNIGRRKNIVANLLRYDFTTKYNIILYETDAPTYIDVDNKFPMTLNSLTISIYDQDNNLLSVGAPDDYLTTSESKTPIKLTLLID